MSDGGITIQLYHPSLKQIILNNFVQENCNSIIYANAAATSLKLFCINNGLVLGSVGVKICEITSQLDLLRFSNLIFKDPATASTKLALLVSGVTTFSLIGVHTEGTNMDYLTDVTNAATFTNFQPVGCDFVGLTALHKTQTPTNTIGEETSIGII